MSIMRAGRATRRVWAMDISTPAQLLQALEDVFCLLARAHPEPSTFLSVLETVGKTPLDADGTLERALAVLTCRDLARRMRIAEQHERLGIPDDASMWN